MSNTLISRRNALKHLAASAALLTLPTACRPKKKRALQYWSHSSGDRIDHAVVEAIRRFESQNPDLSIEHSVVAKREHQAKLHAAAINGSLPDVFNTNSNWIIDAHILDTLAPLNALISPAELKSILQPRDFSRSMVRDHILSLPTGSASAHGVLFSNISLLHELGLPAKSFEGKWAEFTSFCASLSQALNPGDKLERIPFDPFRVSVTPLPVTLAFGLNAPTVSEDGRHAAYVTKAMHEICVEIDNFIEVTLGRFGGYRGLLQWRNEYAHSEAEHFAQFARKRVAFVASGAWVLNDFAATAPIENYAAGPLPGIKRIHGGISSHSWSIGVNRHSENLQSACKFAKFMSLDPDGGQRISSETMTISPLLAGNKAQTENYGPVWHGVQRTIQLDMPYAASANSELTAPLFAEYPYRRLRGEPIDDILGYIQQKHQALLDMADSRAQPGPSS